MFTLRCKTLSGSQLAALPCLEGGRRYAHSRSQSAARGLGGSPDYLSNGLVVSLGSLRMWSGRSLDDLSNGRVVSPDNLARGLEGSPDHHLSNGLVASLGSLRTRSGRSLDDLSNGLVVSLVNLARGLGVSIYPQHCVTSTQVKGYRGLRRGRATNGLNFSDCPSVSSSGARSYRVLPR